MIFDKNNLTHGYFGRRNLYVIDGMIILMLISIIVIVSTHRNNIKLSEFIVEDSLPLVLNLANIQSESRNSVALLNQYLLVSNEASLEQYKKSVFEMEHIIQTTIDENNINELGQIYTVFKRFQSSADDILTIHSDNTKNYTGITYANLNINPLYRSYLSTLEQIKQDIINSDVTKEHRDEILYYLNEMRILWTQLTATLRIYMQDRNGNHQTNMTLYIKTIQEYQDKLIQHPLAEDVLDLPNLNKILITYQERLKNVFDLYKTDKWRQDIYLLKENLIPLQKELHELLKGVTKQQEKNASGHFETLLNQTKNTLFFSLFILMVFLGASIYIIRLVFLILSPVIKLQDFLASYTFSEPKKIPDELISGENEIALLSSSVQEALDRLEHTYKINQKNKSELQQQWNALTRHSLILKFNQKGGVNYANNQILSLTGFSFDVFKTKRILEIFMSPINEGAIDELSQAVAEKNEWQGNVIIRNSEDKYLSLFITLTPFLDAFGELQHYMMIGTDISAHVKAEKEIKLMLRILEKQVDERNIELEQAKEVMEHTYQQLMQSEKLASVGQLAAGVAHEINNPIGYVNSNLTTLNQYLNDLFELIASFEERLKKDNHNIEFIEEIRKQYDFEYLSSDINDLVSESTEGLDRVKKIIQDLKDFSHADAGEKFDADIHQGLNSTLSVAHNEIKHKAEIIKDYGELPMLYCNPSQLNQVFMNLLVNAAQAIKDFGKLTIKTRFDGNNIIIKISDTGEGIPEEILSKIFDPFFTTKAVGQGTGLGLPLSYGIIKKHHGDITVESQSGVGTTFTLRLPVEHPDNEKI